jgi:hypothetical protein
MVAAATINYPRFPPTEVVFVVVDDVIGNGSETGR